jgi:hypothetical protein
MKKLLRGNPLKNSKQYQIATPDFAVSGRETESQEGSRYN